MSLWTKVRNGAEQLAGGAALGGPIGGVLGPRATGGLAGTLRTAGGAVIGAGGLALGAGALGAAGAGAAGAAGTGAAGAGAGAAGAGGVGALGTGFLNGAGAVGASLLAGKLLGGPKSSNLNDASSNLYNTQADLAKQQWQLYMQRYGGPGGIEDQVINDAKNIDSPANISRVQGQAHADASQAADVANKNTLQTLQQYGINPSSDRMAELMSRQAATNAGTDAGLQTTATQNVVNQGIAARYNAAAMGRGLPGAASAGLGSAASGMGTLGNNVFNQNATTAKAVGGMIQPIVSGAGSWLGGRLGGGGGGGVTPNYGTGGGGGGLNMAGGVGNTDSTGTNWSYKDGGLVRGPGTGTSDSIPAQGPSHEPLRVANGEYIIPADVVRHLGVKYFDNLKKKYHAPVHSAPNGHANGGGISTQTTATIRSNDNYDQYGADRTAPAPTAPRTSQGVTAPQTMSPAQREQLRQLIQRRPDANSFQMNGVRG